MKNSVKLLFFLFLLCFTLQSCEDNNDNAPAANIEVQDFIWKGLNLYYLWQTDVANLGDKRFTDQKDFNNFLLGYTDPENLFQNLLNKPVSLFPASGEAIDRFSVIFSDYTQLEGILSGTTKNNGVDFSLYYKDASRTTVIGVVRYIIPNSDAATKNIFRGDIFYAINGETLTGSNYRTLLNLDSFTFNLADYNGGNFSPNGRSVDLTKSVLSENPVLLNKVITIGSHRIGYLIYTGFYPNFETQLNAAFGQLKAEGVTDFVLDLRYNSGGSVATATRLASMITGQFTDQVFAQQQWNTKVEAYFKANNTSGILNLFTNTLENNSAINSLNLSKIYILTTRSTASASELVINGLKPYINVVQIGDYTIGKNVGSITLYDSPTFTKLNLNPHHKYAMQPLVLKIVNKVGFGDYVNGLVPDHLLKEDLGNLGVLGETSEPLLSNAIGIITANGRMMKQNQPANFENLTDSKSITKGRNDMYIDKVPEGISNLIQQ